MPPLSHRARRLPLVIWSVALGALMLAPGGSLPEIRPFDWIDKVGHALAFALHCGLLARWLADCCHWRRAAAQAVLGSGLYAVLLEALQIGVPGRSWEWWDLVADGVGIAVGASLLLLARSRARLHGGS